MNNFIELNLEPETMLVKITNSKLEQIVINKTFQTRAESTLKMLIDALIKINANSNINGNFIIHIGDFPSEGNLDQSINHLYYCLNSNNINIIPDFTFDSWPQAGIQNYSKKIEQIELAGQKTFEIDKMMWIGNQFTHSNRIKFMELANQNSDKILAYNTFVDKAVSGAELPYISLEDHTKYKYLIDIEGRGYSGRLAMLLFTQRMLFIQDRYWKQSFYFDLEPYVHFIPVKNDFSDLLSQIEFVEKQGEQFYKTITRNALEYAKTHLTYEKMIERFAQTLLSYSN